MKKNLTKVMAMAMVMTIAGGATAFAADGLVVAPINAVDTTAAEQTQASAFISQTGKVVSVEDSMTEGVKIVEIDNEQGGLRFAVSGSTVVVDRKDGSYLQASDLEEGMEVAVIYGAMSPMGMSMPPYLGQVTAVVANADAGFFTVGHFDADLTDMSQMLKLNISRETSIQNIQGTRQIMTAEDVANKDALVFYGATTRSIPAQTNPSFVLVLTTEAMEVTPAEEAKNTRGTDVIDATELTEAFEVVALRDAAEELGYKVTWQGKKQPVMVEKDGISIEVKLNDDTYKVNGEAKDASVKAELKGGVMYVSSELFQ